MSYKDRTWCASPQCEGKCGRRLSDHDKGLAQAIGQDVYMSYAYFCGMPEDFTLTQKIREKCISALVKINER
jgi:hypothetical protein